MAIMGDAVLKGTVVKQVPAGGTAVLTCESNDYNHNFWFWLINNDEVIGLDSDFDERKYKYEVLSGRLHINSVTPAESGYYKCISKQLDNSRVAVGQVEMIVSGSTLSAIDAVRTIAIVVSILVLVGCGVLYWRLRKDWNKYDGRSIVPVDDTEDDDGDGDEVYNPTTVSSPSKVQQPVAGPSRNPSSEHLLYGIDNQGLDTDFNSVFENIQIKSPHASLI